VNTPFIIEPLGAQAFWGRDSLVPEPAAVGDHAIGQIKIVASATALQGREPEQPRIPCLVVGVVIRPRRRGAPSSHSPASPFVISDKSCIPVRCHEGRDNIRRFVNPFPRAIHPQTYGAATSAWVLGFRIFAGEGERSLSVLPSPERDVRSKLVVMVLKNDGGLETVRTIRVV
jgi:hypothetical protein